MIQEEHSRVVKRLRRLSYILDESIVIPGINYRIGLDPILGLLPGGGDLACAVISSYIVYAAAQLGVPKFLLARMVKNIAIDTLVGSIPLIGDLFDVMWKANVKNVDLLEEYLLKEQSRTSFANRE
jgi:hypothetical protein